MKPTHSIFKAAVGFMLMYVFWCLSPSLSFAAREVQIYQQSKSLNIALEANGVLPNSGNWSHSLDAAAQAAIGQATRGGIIVGASDVDYPVCAYPKAYCEHDELFVNGQSLGLLEGSDGAAKATEKSIPASILQSTGASINFRVDILDTSTVQYPSNWKVTISSSEIFVYANEEFDLTAAPNSVSTDPDGTATYEISTDFLGVWDNSVNLSVSGLPAGATASFTKTTPGRDGEKSTLTITLNSTAAGTYPLTITGNGTADYKDKNGGKNITRTDTVNLVVEDEPGDFTISASPASRSIDQGASTTYSVDVAFGGTWNTPVALSVTGLPQGANAVFSPAALNKSGQSSLSITTDTFTPEGVHPLIITGTGGGVSKTAAVNLIIGKVADFTLSADPDEIEAEIGGEYESEISVVFAGSCEGPVEISLDKTSLRRLPEGLLVELSGNALDIKDPDETLMIAVDATVPAGEYSVAVNGEGCDITETVTVTILVKAPRLKIFKRQNLSSVLPGQVLVYTISITNEGDFPVTDVVVKDELDIHLELIKHTAEGQHATDGRLHIFSLTEELSPGDTASFQIHAKVDDILKAGVPISNTAEVTAAESPEPGESNTVTAITSYTPVQANALFVEKSLAAGRPKVGGILVYRIRVENRDQTGRVFDIRIDDRLPGGFKYAEGTSLLGGRNIADPAGNGRIVWENLGDLSAGDSLTLKYRVVIGANAKSGRNENCVEAKGVDGGGNDLAGNDCALVTLGPGDIKELGEIKALVFSDTNGNGIKDAADTPLEGAELILVPGGIKQMTDERGETIYPGLSPGRYVLALNVRKLPEHQQFDGDESFLVSLLEGENAEIRFFVHLKVKKGKIDLRIKSKKIKVNRRLKKSKNKIDE